MKLAESSMPRAAFVCVVAAFSGLSCVEQANPVMPSTAGLPGGQVVGSSDAATGQADTNDTAPVVRTDATTVVTCDLLEQDCSPDPLTYLPRACYPEGGIGRCRPIGDGKPAFASCDVNTDCGRGLACVTPCGSPTPECQPICDVTDLLGATDCPDGYVCQAFGKSGSAGFCNLPC
jgi:hypothetical protein